MKITRAMLHGIRVGAAPGDNVGRLDPKTADNLVIGAVDPDFCSNTDDWHSPETAAYEVHALGKPDPRYARQVNRTLSQLAPCISQDGEVLTAPVPGCRTATR